MPSPVPQPDDRAGLAAAFAAYAMWGVLPLYLMALAAVDPGVVLAQRIIWALPTAMLASVVLGQTREIATALSQPKVRAALIVSGLLIGCNWAIYVWAVSERRVVEASLGYFLNPLVNVALGVALLGERLRRAQWIAIALAGLGVAAQAVAVGAPPWVALALCATFAAYGFVRKKTAVGAAAGMAVESLVLFLPAIALLTFFGFAGAALFPPDAGAVALILGLGPATVLPLALFAFAARRLPMTTLGLLQYVAPSLQFAIAIATGEPFGQGQAIGFGLIWAGLAIYTLDALSAHRRAAI